MGLLTVWRTYPYKKASHLLRGAKRNELNDSQMLFKWSSENDSQQQVYTQSTKQKRSHR
jgi:hypothetical protein